MALISTIIIIMLWIMIIIYACVESQLYDPYQWKNTAVFTDDFYFKIFIGVYSVAILLTIAFPDPATINGILQAIAPVLSNLSLLFATVYFIIKTSYDPYGWRQTSDWFTTDQFWWYFILAQVVVIILSITWPYSLSVSRSVWFQLLTPLLNNILTLLGSILVLVYVLWDPYNWRDTPWFSYGILLWIFLLLFAATYIFNSFPNEVANGQVLPTDIIQFKNTTGSALTSVVYIDESGNKMLYNSLAANGSIYFVPKPNSMLLGVDANANVYGLAILTSPMYIDTSGNIVMTNGPDLTTSTYIETQASIGSVSIPFRLYVTGNPATPIVSSTPNTNNLIENINIPTGFSKVITGSVTPISLLIANCNQCIDGDSTFILTTSSTSKTFQLGSYSSNKIQSVVLGVNTLPDTITDTIGNAYTSTTIVNIGQIPQRGYMACYAKHADGTQSCSIIYNGSSVKVFDLMNSSGSIQFFTPL